MTDKIIEQIEVVRGILRENKLNPELKKYTDICSVMEDIYKTKKDINHRLRKNEEADNNIRQNLLDYCNPIKSEVHKAVHDIEDEFKQLNDSVIKGVVNIKSFNRFYNSGEKIKEKLVESKEKLKPIVTYNQLSFECKRNEEYISVLNELGYKDEAEELLKSYKSIKAKLDSALLNIKSLGIEETENFRKDMKVINDKASAVFSKHLESLSERAGKLMEEKPGIETKKLEWVQSGALNTKRTYFDESKDLQILSGYTSTINRVLKGVEDKIKKAPIIGNDFGSSQKQRPYNNINTRRHIQRNDEAIAMELQRQEFAKCGLNLTPQEVIEEQGKMLRNFNKNIRRLL